jgi:hypothetical protein
LGVTLLVLEGALGITAFAYGLVVQFENSTITAI